MHLFGGYSRVNGKLTVLNNTVMNMKIENGKPIGEFNTGLLPLSPHGYCAATLVYRNVIVAGGWSKGATNGVFLFNSRCQEWLQMPSLNRARCSSALVVFNRSLVCIGGLVEDKWTTIVEQLPVSMNV